MCRRPAALTNCCQRFALWRRVSTQEDITYVRFAFCGQVGPANPALSLDSGIVRTLWMTPDEVRANAHRLRSPLVLRCMEDHLAGQRFPLDLIYTDPSVLQAAKG